MEQKEDGVKTWEDCLENRAAFTEADLISGCNYDFSECPHSDNEFSVFNSAGKLVPVCYYKKQWVDVIEDLVSRWKWVFETINQVGHDFDFREMPHPVKTVQEKAKLAQLPLEMLVGTSYAKVQDKVYGFVYPGNINLTKKKVQNIFIEAGQVVPLVRKISFNKRYIPDSMEPATTTPFPNEEELGSVDGFFVHAGEDFFRGEDKLVYTSVGGKGEFASRVLVKMSYKAIFDILNYVMPGKVAAVDFYEE